MKSALKIYPALALFAICFLSTFSISQSTRETNIDDGEAPRSQADLIHFGDLIDVDVIGSFEFDWRGTLTPEGFLAGFDKVSDQIYGLCKSEDEIALAVKREYSKILRDPKVVVRILDRSNRAVAFLDGAVRYPQRLQIRRPVRLNELLIISGGINDNASGKIRIFRPKNLNCLPLSDPKPNPGNANERTSDTLIVNLQDLLNGKDDANPNVLSGDIITVIEADPVYVTGGVASPKQIPVRSELTLTRAIAMAGGLSRNAIPTKVTVFRRDGKSRSVIKADLKAILDKKTDDPLLFPFDVVNVGQEGRGEARLPAEVDPPVVSPDRMSKFPLRVID